MRTVKISELKAQLSAHLEYVKDGEEVVVCDRNRPVARIVPCDLRGRSEKEKALIAQGLLRPPVKRRPAVVSWPTPPGNVSRRVMARIMREEREGR